MEGFDKKMFFLIGKNIKAIIKIHDYLQLYFGDGSVLNIFNTFNLSNNNLLDFKTKTIQCITLQNNIMVIELSDNLFININISDDGYQGPEAFEYCDSKNNIFIF